MSLSLEEKEPYAKCQDCGEYLEEDTIYGEFDDLCQQCCNERLSNDLTI